MWLCLHNVRQAVWILIKDKYLGVRKMQSYIMLLQNKAPQQRSPHRLRHVLTWSADIWHFFFSTMCLALLCFRQRVAPWQTLQNTPQWQTPPLKRVRWVEGGEGGRKEGWGWGGQEEPSDWWRLPPLVAALGSVIGAEKPKDNTGLWDQSLVQSASVVCHYCTKVEEIKGLTVQRR